MSSSGVGLGTTAPTTSAVGDSAAVGSSALAAPLTHVHGREGFGTSGGQAAGGLATAGSAATLARSDHGHGRTNWSPEDHGYLTWTGDVSYFTTGSTVTAGTLYMARVHLPVAKNVTNIVLHLTAAGTSLTSGQCLAALFAAGGTYVDQTADQSTAWASVAGNTGEKTMALSGGVYAAAAGDYYIGWFFNGIGSPTFLRAASQFSINGGLAVPNLRYCSANTSRTTMPNPFGTQSGTSANAWFAALS